MFSPRTKSDSSWPSILYAQSESCSPPANKVPEASNGYLAKPPQTTDVVTKVKASIPTADPYIYCQNDPTYSTHAASAAYVNMYMTGKVQGSDTAWLQLGWRKYRPQGSTNILKQVYVEIYDGNSQNDRTATHYYIHDFGTPPNSAEYEIDKDPTTGAFTFKVGGSTLTLTNLNATLQQYIEQNSVGKAATAEVEIHDYRSHAPGTSGSPFVMGSPQYQRAGDSSLYSILDTPIDPGTIDQVVVSKYENDMDVYDTRN